MLLSCISSERLLTLTACSCVCILGLINYTSKLDNILISSWGHQKPIPGNFEQILTAEAVHNLGSKQPTNRKHIYVWLNLDILQRFSWPRSQHQSQYKDSSLVLILSFCLEWTVVMLLPDVYWQNQEAYKGEIQCPILPNQICFITNHDKFHAAIQLLLLSSNQNTVVHRK